jgi:hypothetical protein
MIITIDQLAQLISSGGCVVLDASTYTFIQLRQFATAANTSKAQIKLIKLSGYTAQQLTELSTLAPKLITFDLTS